MKQYKAIIFDMDGTLFDTEALSLIAWDKAATKYKVNIDKKLQFAFIGLAKKDILKLLKPFMNKGVTAEEVYNYHIIYQENYLKENEIPLKGNVKNILVQLNKQGYKLALATSSYRENAEYLLKKSEIFELFDIVVCGDEIQQNKPHPQIYRTVAERLSLYGHECLVIEDSSNGVKAGYFAGMDVIMIPDLISPDNETKCMCLRIVNDLKMLIDTIL